MILQSYLIWDKNISAFSYAVVIHGKCLLRLSKGKYFRVWNSALNMLAMQAVRCAYKGNPVFFCLLMQLPTSSGLFHPICFLTAMFSTLLHTPPLIFFHTHCPPSPVSFSLDAFQPSAVWYSLFTEIFSLISLPSVGWIYLSLYIPPSGVFYISACPISSFCFYCLPTLRSCLSCHILIQFLKLPAE